MTPQQEKFAQEVAYGKSKSDAYRIAFPKSLKWNPQSVANQANKLMGHPDIPPRIDSIKAELAERGLWTREDSARALIGVVRSPDKASDIVSAVKALNEMHGFDAPIEIKHSGEITAITRRIIDKAAK